MSSRSKQYPQSLPLGTDPDDWSGGEQGSELVAYFDVDHAGRPQVTLSKTYGDPVESDEAYELTLDAEQMEALLTRWATWRVDNSE